MKPWLGITTNGKFAIEIEATVLSELDLYCRDAGSLETGGILIGQYSEDLNVATVSAATPPPSDSRRSRAWFVRGVYGLREILNKRWWAKKRTYYLGEWHFHPVPCVEPSGEDFNQMLEISQVQEYNCKEPLLIIFCTVVTKGNRAFRAFVCPAATGPQELHDTNE